MAKDLNKAQLIGRLGNDPTVSYTNSGKAIATLSVATSYGYNTKEGDKQNGTEWHRVTAWERLAEVCGQYMHKGDRVYIEGRLRTNKWQDAQGATHYSTEVIATDLILLGDKKASSALRVAEAAETYRDEEVETEDVSV